MVPGCSRAKYANMFTRNGPSGPLFSPVPDLFMPDADERALVNALHSRITKGR